MYSKILTATIIIAALAFGSISYAAEKATTAPKAENKINKAENKAEHKAEKKEEKAEHKAEANKTAK